MALREQPYLPLYVQDFLTDEKLIECSAETTGVYIRLMCILHKSDMYGCILLKQKDKQTDDNVKNFANKIAKQMPYDVATIERSLKELIEEKVITLENDELYQKRMKRDAILSDKRAVAGKKGGKGKEKKDFAKANNKAKIEANVKATSEYENEYENEYSINLIDYFQEKIGTISSSICEQLESFVKDIDGPIKVKSAIDKAIEGNVRNFNYIKAILQNWYQKSWADILAEEQKYRNKKESNKKDPAWFDKDISREEMTADELAEIQNSFKEALVDEKYDENK